MRMRYRLLVILSCTWLVVAVAVSLAAVSLVDESGWSEMPVFGWLALAVVFAVALPALLFGGHRWVINADG